MVRFCIQLIQGLQGEDWFYTIPMDRLGLRALHFEPDVKKLSHSFFLFCEIITVVWNNIKFIYMYLIHLAMQLVKMYLTF